MMTKYIGLDDRLGDALTVQPMFWTSKGQDTTRIKVSGEASEALRYLRALPREPDKTAMLVLAFGAHERYGMNRNGDTFSERPVEARPHKVRRKEGSLWRAVTDQERTAADPADRYWVPPGEEVPPHCTSFERGRTYIHHVNKDPRKGTGDVKRAFWNPRMARCELVVSVRNSADPEWISKLADGEFPPVSMGCRIKRDVCGDCGNEAASRSEYCKEAREHLGEILDDGTACCVYNPAPDFFDLSRVSRPADPTGYTLAKAAHALDPADRIVALRLASYATNAAALAQAHRTLREPLYQGSVGREMVRQAEKLGQAVLSTPPVKNAAIVQLVEAFDDMPVPGALFVRTALHRMKVAATDALVQEVLRWQPNVLRAYAQSPALADDVLSGAGFTGTLTYPSHDVRTAAHRVMVRVAAAGEYARLLVPESLGLYDQPARASWAAEDPSKIQGDLDEQRKTLVGERLAQALGLTSLALGAFRLLKASEAYRDKVAYAMLAENPCETIRPEIRLSGVEDPVRGLCPSMPAVARWIGKQVIACVKAC